MLESVPPGAAQRGRPLNGGFYFETAASYAAQRKRAAQAALVDLKEAIGLPASYAAPVFLGHPKAGTCP